MQKPRVTSSSLKKQKQLYDQAYKFISRALDKDGTSKDSPAAMARSSPGIIDDYTRGLALLDQALALRFSPDEWRNAQSLHDKMRSAHRMVSERLQSLSTAASASAASVGTSSESFKTRSVPSSSSFVKPPALSSNELPSQIDRKLAEQLLDQIVTPASLNITFESIVGLKHVKQQIMDTLVLPALRPDIYTGLLSPSKSLLLFGPPGTGKTFLAKAIAGECKGYTFLGVSASTVVSKWMGEGEKLVRTLFDVARFIGRPDGSSDKHRGCILFIDEIDSVLGRRGESGEQEASRRLKTEFLVQMDGVHVNQDETRVIVIGATNRPQDLDEAAIRRFPKRIYVPLPDSEARMDLLKKLLESHPHPKNLSRNDLNNIVKLTEGYSCSDLTALSKEAAIQPLHEYSPEQIRTLPTTKRQMLRPINYQDFVAAASVVRKSVSDEERLRVEQWAQNFGYMKT